MLEQVLIAVGVMSVLVLVVAGAVTVLAVRAVRRRYRSARAQLAGIGSSPGWWAAQNRRRRMWRSVTAAEQAVALAMRSEVAVGDLPGLTRRLRAAAEGTDALLRASAAAGSFRDADRRDCDRIEAAAADIHRAALSSLRSANRADTDPVVSAVRIEAAALAAGVRAAHR